MKFESVPPSAAEGAILAHSQRLGPKRLRKGMRLSAADCAALDAAGVAEVMVAILGDDDLSEDIAAHRIATRLAAPGISVSAPFTGRANIHAEHSGVLKVDAEAVAALNAIEEGITLATLPPFTRVAARQMLATVKIIPYAVGADHVAAAEAAIASPPLTLHPFRIKTAALILTQTPDLKPRLLHKAEDSMRARLAQLGVALSQVDHVPHTTSAVAKGCASTDAEMILIFGATATSDRRDVCPAALVAAGGTLTRFGMPVDPGNLLFLGKLGDRPVIGLPGCARSPALNGADWVLERVVAGLDPSHEDIAAMGVGGLLKEIPTRPQPRSGNLHAPERPVVEALILAGGQSQRMRGRDKLLEEIDGAPLLRRVAETALAAQVDGVRVVIPEGHATRQAALEGLDVAVVMAEDTRSGMATSLRAGIASLSPQTDAVLVLLADMPEITPAHLDNLLAAFDPSEGRSIARAVAEDGTPGHPVLFGKRFFENLAALEGDTGAKEILREAADYVVDVPTPGQGAVVDLDTPEAWAAWRAQQV